MKVSRPKTLQKSSSPAPSGADGSVSPLMMWIAAFVLAAAVFAIYSPALDFQFVLDDHRFVGDPRVQTPGHLWEYFTSYVWAQIPGGPSSFYRPLFVVWLRLNFILSEMSPWGWHLLSIAKHLLVAVLLGLLVWKLLRDRIAALLAAILFALHPAHTESVAWVTVPDPLMAAASLGSLFFYLEYAERVAEQAQASVGKSAKKSRKQARDKSRERTATASLVASVGAFLTGLLAKETAIVLIPVLFAVALIVPFASTGGKEVSKPGRPEVGTRIVFALREIALFLGVTAVYLICRFYVLGGITPATQHLSFNTVVLSWPATLWFYVKVLFWPIRSRAFADPTVEEMFSLRGVVLPGLGVACAVAILLGACIWGWRTAQHDFPDEEATRVQRAVVLGALILVLPILLALNLNALNPGDFLHGRYTYLSLAGLMILLATLWHLSNKGRIVLLAVAGVLAIAFSVLTVKQEGAWKDDLTIFTVAHENAPHNAPVTQNLARTHVQIALSLDEEGRCDEAVPMFEEAIQQYPQDWFAWAGLGECRVKLNDLAGAEQSLRRASELSHEPRVREQWEAVRAKMGLPPAPQ